VYLLNRLDRTWLLKNQIFVRNAGGLSEKWTAFVEVVLLLVSELIFHLDFIPL